jgi:hypothetical protein
MVTEIAAGADMARHSVPGRSRRFPCSHGRTTAGRHPPTRASDNWFYYVDSATAEGTGLAKEAFRALGRPGYHPDDWESYQVRIKPDGSDSRAGSHHGYNYEGCDRGPGWLRRFRFPMRFKRRL